MAMAETEDDKFFMLLMAYTMAEDEEQEDPQQQEQEQQPQQDGAEGYLRGAMGRRPSIRRFWVRNWLTNVKRLETGQFDSLVNTELRLHDHQAFHNYTRLTPAMFDEVLLRVGPAITRARTNCREPLSPGLKLALTLRYLATGTDYRTLSFAFRVGVSTISDFIPEVCRAIISSYRDEAMNLPLTPQAWRALADQFQTKWNVPHAIGALDGKHIAIKKPAGSGSLYHNYKGFFSIPLLALVDAEYRFIWMELGGVGHMSDAQIFRGSELFEHLEDAAIRLPPATPLPGEQAPDFPYFILGDDAFALSSYLMKPFSRRGLSREQRICNYRISRGRRVVENAFGILANRFRCLLRTMEQKPDNILLMVETVIILHNLLRGRQPLELDEVDQEDDQHNIQPGAWRQQATWPEVNTPSTRARNASRQAKAQRDHLMAYFNSAGGAVEWQERLIGQAPLQEPAEEDGEDGALEAVLGVAALSGSDEEDQ